MEEIKSPIKAIRAKCLDCCGGSSNEVKLCPATECPIYAFRFGRNPYRTVRVMTEEQKAAASERLRLAREQKKQD
jgi:hypothetical protein